MNSSSVAATSTDTQPPPGEASVAGTTTAKPHARSLVHGIAWTGVVKWSVQIVTWGSTIVVARLLTPEDYGLVGMASLYLGYVTRISEFGLGTTILTLRELDDRQVAQMNSVALMLGAVGILLSCLAAIPLGDFFNAPALPLIVVVMSVSFLITAFSTVPMALLQRDLQFKLLALVDGGKALLTAVATIVLAWLGFRYWALVVGGLLGTALATGVVVIRRPHGFAWPKVQALKRALSFSRDILVGRLAWYWYTTADFLVAGRVLGKAPLGAYNFAWTLATMIPAKVTDLVSKVTPAFFSAVQDDRAALRRYLLTLTEGIALLTFPATVGMALVAEDFVALALGDQWMGAVAPLQILAVYAGIRSIAPLLNQVLVVVGEERFAMWNTLGAAVLMPIAFWIGSRWGGAGIAVGWLMVHPLILAWALRRVFYKIELPLSQYLAALWPSLSGSLAMVAAVVAVQGISADWPLALRLGSQVVAGALTYGGVLFLLHRNRLREAKRLLRLVRK